MTEELENKSTLSDIGEPDKIEIVPGLVLEDKIRIKTQRRLEKHFNLPIGRIFPGSTIDPISKKLITWEGIDFNFLNNSIPLLTILAKQVDDNVTENFVEEIFDSTENINVITKNLEKYFRMINPDAKLKNFQKSNPKKK